MRLDRHLSTRHIAKETGIEPMNYHRLESADNPNLSSLTVAVFLRLADYLRVPAGQLFTEPANPDTSVASDPRSHPDTDARTLGALLRALDTKANKTALVDSLDWTMERLHAASDLLDRRVEAAGMTLFDADGRLWLGPLLGDHAAAETRFRQHHLATPRQRLVTAARARILHAAANGGYHPTKGGDDERQALAGLMRAGLLEAHGNTYLADADVLFSLDPTRLP
jgi:transcriptional regulator with XRE-family HTH domain